MQQIRWDMLQGLIQMARRLRAFAGDRKAAVSIIAALSLPALIAFSSLVAEYGHGLLVKTENQRVSDLASYAGALAYNSTASTDSMTAAVNQVAALNGISSSSVAATLVSSPSGDGNQAVRVNVSTTVPIYLASVVGGATSLSVKASSYAELNVQTTGCIIALSAGKRIGGRFLADRDRGAVRARDAAASLGRGGATSLSVKASSYAELNVQTTGCIIALSAGGAGVTLSGGTAVTATGCSVASNNSETVPCGTSIVSKWVTYNGAAPTQGCSGITGPNGASVSISRKATADPLAGASAVTTATGRVTTVTGYSGPAAPTVTAGTDITFGYSQSTTVAQLPSGCAGAFASNTWTVTCTGHASYNFGALSLAGGITLNFNTGGSASTIYNFSGLVNDNGSAITFGPGVYNMAKGLMSGGGSTTILGAGTFNIGKSTTACGDGVFYSICNSGTLMKFKGPSSFALQGGVYNNGGSDLIMGDTGTGNSFVIGPASSGNAMWLGGGAYTKLGDATDAGSVFQVVGNFWVPSGGGSCTWLPAAAQHDIKGNFLTAGGTTLGSGVYTITGYMDIGGTAGGDVSCDGASVGLSGSAVTIVLGGASLPASGTCSGQVFCVAAGYGHVSLTAPSGAATTAGLVVVGPASATGGATFAEGASNTSLSGAFYFPQGAISLSGGASVGGGTGQCLELIGTQVTLSGGTAAASNCVSASASSVRIALVQ